MNRFTFDSRQLALAAAVLGLALPAFAQDAPVRPFPPKAERGAMVITNPPDLVLNGKTARLSPGARIRGANNMLVMSGALVGQNLLVNYVLEPNGLVHEVWILTEAEAKLVRPTGGITLVK
ncbi:hypothetical protein [Rhodoferax saidenbachensis]|uniref:MSHA biogenesis protein MshK n=1 Tax=Rhodoferax saidenbachensis TaxID=1484693 RepID=A0A1P8KDH0_9BURK|nr:hypothetical protein [Rhodoferax saidenbachensis]APW44059.1 hypothetical protein RS694_16975 [Rhodoferax saidenbachensis]